MSAHVARRTLRLSIPAAARQLGRRFSARQCAAVSSQAENLIVADKLKPLGLSLAPEADRRTLIRRATLDLHGMPPTPAEVEAFVAPRGGL